MDYNDSEQRYNEPRRIDTAQGRVTANEDYIRNLRKQNRTLKIQNNRFRKVIVAGALVLFLLTAKVGYDLIPRNPSPIALPDGYVMIHVSDSIGSGGDNIYNNALEYWNSDLYGFAYKDINHYVASIASESGIRYPNRVNPGQSLRVPVIVPIDGEAAAIYTRISELETEIDRILQEEKWIDYVVKPGDTLLAIAGRAAGSKNGWIDTNIQYSIKDEITSRNGMRSSSILRDGTTIEIVNPILGPLRTELNTIRGQLNEAAKTGQTNDGPIIN